MKNEYLLQDEFTHWLDLQNDSLCFKSSFYSYQINKIHSIFALENGFPFDFSDALENEIICNNPQGVEVIILKVLDKMEHNGFCKDVDIPIKALEAMRIGLLKYRLFLHHFLASRNTNYNSINSISNYFSETKQLHLVSLFKGNKRYSFPVYQDVYIYNALEVDALWQKLLKSHEDQKLGTKDAHGTMATDLGTIVVKKREKKQLEVVDGGQTLITLSILMHVLTQFSKGTKGAVGFENRNRGLSQIFSFKTELNDQKLFRVLVNNGINKCATSANEISKGIMYRCEEPGLNNGYAFLQTTFRFVQFVQEAKIPQSDHYIANMDAFFSKVLKNHSITIKKLSLENRDKTYLNRSTILVQNIMEWL
ncbi:DUF262 domain-containing protein [Lacinutrix himadriensis]|uniref:DUF262 domain-containing protein n=1 Tax=Lacinutrix himadriensis TaxID=641549 RepID=UPI0006E1C290|nr:DUF262 domain-containing protein [Lacinutrix himadriensis]